ncbi:MULTISPECIES: DUF87 domain-containing protein [unclassified Bradyrhizobium]|uniref:helicase HerA domain-containing protein n=1 Tax=Bradyrhizobium sp. NBAIM08 TaxID=2793815 RepID=UPI001CD7C36B
MGSHSASESLEATLDLDKLVTRHAAIVGSTGAGKSNTVAAILKALKTRSFRIANTAPHGQTSSRCDGLRYALARSAVNEPHCSRSRLLGQIGSFVRIPLGFLNAYGIVSMVGTVAVPGEDPLMTARSAEYTLEIKLIGEAYRNSPFQRGLSVYAISP